MINLKGIRKSFYVGKPNELEILHGLDLTVRKGEFLSIVGASGSGKTTFMNVIGILDRPTAGEYHLDGVDVCAAKDRELSRIRNRKIGFVFQTYNLISRTTALKNVELPMLYAGIPRRERQDRARELLSLVEMEDRMSHKPDELSGGQKQRVAIARAMSNNPSIILADEPTGSLDSVTGRKIMDLFHKLNEEQGITILLITHSMELAEETGRIITIKDGRITGERRGQLRPGPGTAQQSSKEPLPGSGAAQQPHSDTLPGPQAPESPPAKTGGSGFPAQDENANAPDQSKTEEGGNLPC